MPDTPRYDLILKNGHVIDAAQGINGKRDVGIANGRVADVEPDLPADRAERAIDVAGKYVVPGLIDLHTHVYAGVSIFGIEADDLCPKTGVTTSIDVGSAGWVNFAGLKRYVIRPSQTRILAFVHLSAIGLTFRRGELIDEAWIQPQECAKVVRENRDVALGVKVRLYRGVGGDADLADLLKLTVDAAQRCESPLMVHISGSHVPLTQFLPLLRPGDIITHCCHGLDPATILDAKKKVLPEVREARDRGIVFDIGHGAGSFHFDVGRVALEEGFPPDTISSDIHTFSINGPVFDLPTTMSKFLNLGMPLEEAVERTTLRPARAIGKEDEMGSLRPGLPADVAVLDLRTGQWEMRDSYRNARMGDRRLVCALSVRNGKVWYNAL
ncbi:MAG: dihydroorotase [Candidatus Handelsmanbacteria bacterium RIFCSPLOWO2_12_FULL_64_10]|uniref:Dihydroorotase n=1 Tax=Handelsmanbacteria sp. (strain RIFCSPLOWO2_12_FULL_64_10) TaxID=1817868 RepID=A0A1F6C4K9_HANXR|nr:MAG: dihydroorotase [Candidatus Handelsmanbacteria bacterium RIFCSPLOWO2_12_FULL_64_10]